MTNPYSNDLRERVINYLEKELSVNDAIKKFNVRKSAIYTWKKRYEATGDFKPLLQKRGRKSNLLNEQLEEINNEILSQPDNNVRTERKIQFTCKYFCIM